MELIKVKAHEGIWGNEQADKLAKQGLYEGRILTQEYGDTRKYCLHWYGEKVEHNNRKFVKMLNKTKNEIKENELNRIKHLENNFNKVLSYKILNSDNEKNSKKTKNNKFLSMEGNKYKSFKIKKLIKELLTLKKLKQR